MKKKERFFLRVFFLAVFIVLLTACSSDTESNEQVSDEDGEVNEETETLTIAFPYFYGEPEDLEKVETEISKLAEEKINTTVDILALSISAYQQQMNLMLTSDEKLDLMVILADQLSPQVSRGQLHELDNNLSENGQGIIDAVGEEFLAATKINGKQYAIPTVRDMAASYGFMMSKEYVDKYDIDVDQIKTMEDMGEVLRMVKENEPNMEPLTSTTVGESIMETLRFVDPLSDFNGGVLPNYDNDLQVVNLYEMPEYVERLEILREWYQEGLIVQDIATSQTTKDELLKAGKIFAFSQGMKPGIETQNSRDMNQDMVAAEIIPPVATTSNVASIMWGIPRNSKIPEKAMEFLNLLYMDKEMFNLISWGIEGEHYVKVSDKVITYPEGVTSENIGYSFNSSWLFGNQFLSYVFEGEDPDIWEETKEFNEEATKSKALGFNFNSDPVRTEVAAVSNVKEQYLLGLETGSLDLESVYPEFIERLKEAGIEKIIEEKQRQLDEWAEINGVEKE
ncbi:multiple sugar ABC transporter [Gracilibacillus boraciitolerans JCM 21714]|uniref:Multiple sugar ABC transporter n=1 Tax=Gracilibacillus boraciitolerans JCM 21714 TaxID=1298598 RepID=W4VJW5_9BACI|nr:ABC transporter substrate-binding protein [Gracilibacillus boraciitolerans]GAE93118.1 multiple sugar ABC transporter [Gracilibacillus boraciitolerans JCM 21714]